MRIPTLPGTIITLGATALLAAMLSSGPLAQAPAAPAPAQEAVVYPASEVTAGEPLFVAYCGFCHGRDATGGTTGPDLTRSVLVSEDVKGDRIKPVIRTGRPDRGMPPISISEAEMTSIVAYVHDRRIKEGSLVGQRRRVSEDDVNTGDAKAGEAYFNGPGKCATCHSPTGDLAGVADRYKGLGLLQRILNPGGGGRGGQGNPAKVTVTLPSGETVSGRLANRDEFTIALRDGNGWYRSWSTKLVQFTVDNPVEAHADQIAKYTDADMHNVLAYVQTMKRPGGTPAPAAQAPGTAPQLPAIAPYTGGGLEPATLLAPPADTWATYHGDYS